MPALNKPVLPSTRKLLPCPSLRTNAGSRRTSLLTAHVQSLHLAVQRLSQLQLQQVEHWMTVWMMMDPIQQHVALSPRLQSALALQGSYS
jgi:hypothetical protein